MKERPILFKGPLVRAILAGQKTVTRRVVTPQFHTAPIDVVDGVPSWDSPTNYAGEVQMNTQRGKPCPFGQPGDRLWVRETFIDLRGTGVEHRPDPDGPLQRYAYASDCRPGSHSDEARKEFGLKYKPSIHMPRAACRILLEITDVHVERLQDISTEQIIAEGLSTALREHDAEVDLRRQWRDLWESTGGNWDANPWVWVVEFKRVTPS